MDYMPWVGIILSLAFAAFSDELKQLKVFIFDRSGNLKKRFVDARSELINRYKDCPIYRSYSNVIAIKSMLLGFFYFFMFVLLSIYHMVLSIREEQMNLSDLSFTALEFNIAATVLGTLTFVYLISAGFRMRCHNKASQ